MKPCLKKLAYIILCFLCVMVLYSCGEKKSVSTEEHTTESAILGEDAVYLSNGRIEGEYINLISNTHKYTIIYPKNDYSAFELATKVRNAIKTKSGVTLKIQSDNILNGNYNDYKYEILVGNTNRKGYTFTDRESYIIKVSANRVYIYGSNDVLLQKGVDYFISRYINTSTGEIKIDKKTNIEEINGAYNIITSTGFAKSASIEYISENNEYKIKVFTNTTKINLLGVAVKVTGKSNKSYNFASDTLFYSKSQNGIYECSFNIKDIAIQRDSDFLVFNLTPYTLINGDIFYGENENVIASKNEVRNFSDIEKRDNKYLIKDFFDFILFSTEANNGKRYISAELQSDMYFDSGFNYIPIGGENASYKGIFDGKEFEIKNLHIYNSNIPNIGLFGVVGSGAIIKNLVIKNANIIVTESKTAGILSGENRGEISNCVVINSTIEGKSENDISVGGITGLLNGKYNAIISDSTFEGKINFENIKTANVGGIAGTSTATKAEIIGCTNYGDLTLVGSSVSLSSLGGICGSVTSGLIYACENKGRVICENEITPCGGIVGTVHAIARIVECGNSSIAIIKSGFYAGGIVGCFAESVIGDGMILRSYNEGNVISTGENAGGIVGVIKSSSFIYYSYNKGEVRARNNAGGICGYTNIKRSYIMNCFNLGIVFSLETQYANEIIGKTELPFDIFYLGLTNSEDLFVNYKNNYYIKKYNFKGEQTNFAFNREKTEYGCENIEELKRNVTYNNSPFIESTYIVTPILKYQEDETKHLSYIPPELYIISSETIVDDNSGYYLTQRYLKNIYDGKDNAFSVSISDFYRKLDIESTKTHFIISKSGESLSECKCSVFDGDHYIKIEVWKRILEDAEKYLCANANLFNYGEIVSATSGIKVDIDTDSLAYCRKVKKGEIQYYDKIALNPDYFNENEDREIIAHELAHAMHANFGCEDWLKEGMADYGKYKTVGNTSNLLPSKTKDYEYKKGYKDTAAVLIFIENNFSEYATRQIIRMMEHQNEDFDKLMYLSLGATYEEIFTLFQKAEYVSDIIAFND